MRSKSADGSDISAMTLMTGNSVFHVTGGWLYFAYYVSRHQLCDFLSSEQIKCGHSFAK